MKDLFIIKDIENFTDVVRSMVYQNFGSWEDSNKTDGYIPKLSDQDKEDMDKTLSHNESLNIIKDLVKKQKHKLTGNIRYIVSEDSFAKILDNLNSRMVSNILTSLVNKGLVESSYDSELNDFVFWCKTDDDKETETD